MAGTRDAPVHWMALWRILIRRRQAEAAFGVLKSTPGAASTRLRRNRIRSSIPRFPQFSGFSNIAVLALLLLYCVSARLPSLLDAPRASGIIASQPRAAITVLLHNV